MSRPTPIALLLLTGTLAACAPAPGAGAQAIPDAAVVAAAEARYVAGDFDAAADLYADVLDGGARRVDVFYNLGLAELGRGDTGRAILNLRRAERLAPRDADVRAALAAARSEGGIAAAAPDGVDGWLARLRLGRADLALACLGLWWAWAILTLAARHVRPARGTLGGAARACAMALALGVAAWVAGPIRDRIAPEGVVVTESPLTSGPGPATTFAVVAEPRPGTLARRVEQRGDWVRVSLGDGRDGWLPRDAVAPVAVP